MNEAFGNKKGDPHAINAQKLLKQCTNIGAEYIELMQGFGKKVTITIEDLPTDQRIRADKTVDHIRDALCDINVFSLGGHHLMGYDARLDMRAVYESNMSKFITGKDELIATQDKFDTLGVEFYREGAFPRMCLKSATDQQMPEYPKGKFLKGINTKKPVFYQIPAPTPAEIMDGFDAVVDMQRERETRKMQFDRDMKTLNEDTAAFRAKRELELFGLPAYSDKDNQTPGTVDEAGLRRLHEKDF